MQYMGGKFRISTELANLLNIYIYIYIQQVCKLGRYPELAAHVLHCSTPPILFLIFWSFPHGNACPAPFRA